VERVPELLIDRLNPGGRLAAIVGTAPVMQAVLIERVGSGLASSASGMRTTVLFETLTKPLEDAPKVSKFTF
jgi:protein-L-isoaspartate(D-aspartate) O-methyltransferase